MTKLLSILLLGVTLVGVGAQTTPTIQFKTLADMIAFSVPSTINNRLTAIVSGRNTTNDNAGGIFVYDGSSTASTNLGTIFKPSTNTIGRWVRQYNLPVNARWFDARGDDSHDDYLPLQNAIDIGHYVYIPAGTYRLTNSLTINSSNFKLYGDGNATTLKAYTSGQSVIDTDDIGTVSFWHLHDFACGFSGGQVYGPALNLIGVQLGLVEGINIDGGSGGSSEGFSNAIRITTTGFGLGYYNRIKNCYLRCAEGSTNNAAILLENQANSTFISGNIISASKAKGLVIDGSGQVEAYGNDFHGGYIVGIYDNNPGDDTYNSYAMNKFESDTNSITTNALAHIYNRGRGLHTWGNSFSSGAYTNIDYEYNADFANVEDAFQGTHITRGWIKAQQGLFDVYDTSPDVSIIKLQVGATNASANRRVLLTAGDAGSTMADIWMGTHGRYWQLAADAGPYDFHMTRTADTTDILKLHYVSGDATLPVGGLTIGGTVEAGAGNLSARGNVFNYGGLAFSNMWVDYTPGGAGSNYLVMTYGTTTRKWAETYQTSSNDYNLIFQSISDDLGIITNNNRITYTRIGIPIYDRTIALTNITASRVAIIGADNQLSNSVTTTTELGYLNGVTSSIQNQLNAKIGSASNLGTGVGVYAGVTSVTNLTFNSIAGSGGITASSNANRVLIGTTTGAGITNSSSTLSANLIAGSNITLSTNAGGQISITASGSGSGSTNAVYVNGVAITGPNFIDSPGGVFNATGTNITITAVTTANNGGTGVGVYAGITGSTNLGFNSLAGVHGITVSSNASTLTIDLAPTNYITVSLSNPNAVLATPSSNFWVAPLAGTLKSATVHLLAPSSSGSVTIDLKKNGTTMLSAPVSMAAGATNATASLSVTSFSALDRLVGEVTAAGTTAYGAQLKLGVTFP